MRAILVAALLLFAHAAAAQHPAQQALSPKNCGHGNHPPCPPPPPPPPPAPTPIGIAFTPAMPTIADNTPVGTTLASISVTMSDGSAFSGALGFGPPNGSDGGFCAIVGRLVVLGVVPPPGASVQHCTVTATQ